MVPLEICAREDSEKPVYMRSHNDWVYGQAYLRLCWAHISECTFCQVAAHCNVSVSIEFAGI